MFWRMTAQRLLVESKNQTAIAGLFQIVNKQSVDEIGLNSPAIHALWALKGLGALNGSNLEAWEVVKKAFFHPAAGVRKAAIEVLPSNQLATDAILSNKLINDANLNVRKSVILAIAALPPSNELGKLVQEASTNPENEKDEWIAKALFAASISHRDGFLAASPAFDKSINDDKLKFSEQLAKLVTQEIYLIDRRNPITH